MGHDFFKIKATDEDIIFSAQPKFLHAVGLVKNRYSMTIGQYKEKTGFDPVSEHIRRQYMDHLEMQEALQKEGFTPENMVFDTFNERELVRLQLSG